MNKGDINTLYVYHKNTPLLNVVKSGVRWGRVDQNGESIWLTLYSLILRNHLHR